jgi:hypothetical protein
MSAGSIYSDKLVTITDERIIFENYYFLTWGKKTVRFDSIEHIVVNKPTMWNGKYRIQGTGNFKTWYPMDSGRPKRDRIFLAVLKNQWVNIGFTVVEGNQVEKILRDKNLIK